jgi:hypothetical protein
MIRKMRRRKMREEEEDEEEEEEEEEEEKEEELYLYSIILKRGPWAPAVNPGRVAQA